MILVKKSQKKFSQISIALVEPIIINNAGFQVKNPHKNNTRLSLLKIFNVTSTGCRKINVFQVGGLVGKNLRNVEKINKKYRGALYKDIWVLKIQTFHHVFFK
jgi:hypothetical protein